jgi:hypothetical protein
MVAVDQPPDPYQRAALIVARWSGARRDEIRRLAVDCLDTYPDGNPRLRIPVGKGHTERSIPLHLQAAEALRPLIDRAASKDPALASTPAPVVRCSTCSWSAAGCCPTHPCSTCRSKPRAPPPVSSTRPASRRSLGTGSGTPSAPNSPKAALAFRRARLCSATRRPTCRSSTRRCPTRPSSSSTKTPSTDTSPPISPSLDQPPTRSASTASTPEAVSWLQTNFLNTELELGHCLRTPAEPVRVRPGADLFEVPHHERLRAPAAYPTRRRAAADRGRSRTRVGP